MKNIKLMKKVLKAFARAGWTVLEYDKHTKLYTCQKHMVRQHLTWDQIYRRAYGFEDGI